MNINVDSLNSGFSKEVHFKGNITLPNDSSFNKEAYINGLGAITNSSGKYTFIGKASSTITRICNSCLEEFPQSIELDDIIEVFSKDNNMNDTIEKCEKHENSDYDENNDIWLFSSKDNNINLEQPIVTNILLNMPMKALCIDNCKGLCRVCGHNLNIDECGCDRGFIDPRFEGFLNIFDDK